MELSYDGAIPLLGIYPKKMKTRIQKDTCIPMFVAALFTIVKIWEQPKCPSTDEEWIKMWCVHARTHAHAHTHTGILLSHEQEIKSCHLQQCEWTWRVLCLVKEIRERKMLSIITYMWSLKK